MENTIAMHQALTNVDDSVLIVIDVQQAFVDRMPESQMKPIINRISWMVQMAVKFNVPIVATAEDISESGTNIPQVADFSPLEQKNTTRCPTVWPEILLSWLMSRRLSVKPP